MNKVFVGKYINELKEALKVYYEDDYAFDDNYLYDIIRRCLSVIGPELCISETVFAWKSGRGANDAETLVDLLEYKILKDDRAQIAGDDKEYKSVDDNKDNMMIFLSHKSDDKKYANAIRNFIVGLGVKDNQLIYTSHPMHKIPLDENIYDYLRSNINSNIFMIILWSDKYLESPACLNEMGAAWVAQSDYTNIYVPDFSFGNPKYRECAVDTRKMGAVLNGDEHCKASLLELKDKIVNMFALSVDEKKTAYLIDEFIKEIM